MAQQDFRSYAHFITIDKCPAALQINQFAFRLSPLIADCTGSHTQQGELAPLQEPVSELRADCYGVRLNLFTVQVTIIEVSPTLKVLKTLP